MSDLNWGRFIVGGMIASIIVFVTDGLLHETIVGADWKAVYDNLGAASPVHNSVQMIYFAIFELGRGFGSMFLYVLMRRHYKPGPKTAALAGVAAWIAFSLTGPAQFIPLGFYSNALWVKVTAFQLVTSIVVQSRGRPFTRTPSIQPLRWAHNQACFVSQGRANTEPRAVATGC